MSVPPVIVERPRLQFGMVGESFAALLKNFWPFATGTLLALVLPGSLLYIALMTGAFHAYFEFLKTIPVGGMEGIFKVPDWMIPLAWVAFFCFIPLFTLCAPIHVSMLRMARRAWEGNVIQFDELWSGYKQPARGTTTYIWIGFIIIFLATLLSYFPGLLAFTWIYLGLPKVMEGKGVFESMKLGFQEANESFGLHLGLVSVCLVGAAIASGYLVTILLFWPLIYFITMRVVMVKETWRETQPPRLF